MSLAVCVEKLLLGAGGQFCVEGFPDVIVHEIDSCLKIYLSIIISYIHCCFLLVYWVSHLTVSIIQQSLYNVKHNLNFILNYFYVYVDIIH